MTREEAIEMLKSKMDGHTDTSYEWAETVRITIKALEQKPCEDCISRQAVLDLIADYDLSMGQVVEGVHALPSVTPQPKMGWWLAKSFHEVYCDNCGFDFDIMTNEFIDKMRYCPNCGIKMQEVKKNEH